jgi:hypothetical protein
MGWPQRAIICKSSLLRPASPDQTYTTLTPVSAAEIMVVDPISVTVGIFTILKATSEVALRSEWFRDDTSVVHFTLSDLLNNVTGFRQVLETMHETFSRDDIDSAFGATGHIGNHWTNLLRALESGTETAKRLHVLLDSINTDKSFLDGPR